MYYRGQSLLVMIKIYYYKTRRNVGDYYGWWLIHKLLPNHQIKYSRHPDIICCGSIIDLKFPKKTLCWGCGIHNQYDNPPYTMNKSAYYAVRGKLTAKRIGLKNIPTGDPGTLAPLFYSPRKTKKKYKYAIVSHYFDSHRLQRKFGKRCLVISTITNDVESFLDKLSQCEFIFSSSLHGIIFSHALGIPAIHIEDKKLESRGNFKFKDYYSNLDIPYTKFKVTDNLDFVNKYIKEPKKYLPSRTCIKNIQTRLLKAFPYKELKNK